MFLWHREHRSRQGVRQIHPVFVDCIESMVLTKGLPQLLRGVRTNHQFTQMCDCMREPSGSFDFLEGVKRASRLALDKQLFPNR
jgi:hypothetical protein